ncbi:DNA repair protein RecN [Vallitalea pronyensis]|uniref:DNA repair protein RecN n=1 Tax=Vallitalea pronyensis TaxID=1348613 RepID=A0A8J8ML83_9FIRM|nr:DNA repair protein RecN [Vallitalea pronyensis]QUI23795.1 DNA repair protein RecN [Vallitalea pronyensis]
MLMHLHVKNIALIDEMNVDFNHNLNIMTGETGAGKSIIIGSINAVLGEKVSKDIIRTGCDNALIELLFHVNNKTVMDKLHGYDINIDDSKELLITRKIGSNGRSVFRMNGQVVTTAIVKDVSAKLIDIHGQHAHQSLLNRKNHLRLLDTFCGEDILVIKDKLKIKYQRYQELCKQVDHSLLDEQKRKQEISFLEFEINEIESANLKTGEDNRLEEDYKRLSNGKKIARTLSHVLTSISGDDSAIKGGADLIGEGVHILGEIKHFDTSIDTFHRQLLNIEMLMSDCSRDMHDYLNDFELDESQFEEVENRMDQLNHLKMKYGQSIQEIIAYKQDKEKRLDELVHFEAHLHKINLEIDKIKKEIEEYCERLSQIRKERAKYVSKSIVQALKDINLQNTDFVINVDKSDAFNSTGWDDVEFLISTNVGEPPKSLDKVASGGELSRIMLAIKSILANSDDINTLIFDEIDTGISGMTAGMVAEKLAHISKRHQVICITHLPQIAAMGDTHYMIKKIVEKNNTLTTINPLNKEYAIKELARLLGGVQITDATMANAEEMINFAEELKRGII